MRLACPFVGKEQCAVDYRLPAPFVKIAGRRTFRKLGEIISPRARRAGIGFYDSGALIEVSWIVVDCRKIASVADLLRLCVLLSCRIGRHSCDTCDSCDTSRLFWLVLADRGLRH